MTNADPKMRVALPVCVKDANLMLHNLQWQFELDGRKEFDCVLCLDGQLSAGMIANLELAASRTYAGVTMFIYPPAPQPRWPNGPNWAFQHTAHFMRADSRSWFWMESDCIALKPGWLDRWNQEYNLRQKSIMGVLVPGMGHCNGTAVYPANFPSMSPRAMICTDVAWDGLMQKDTIQNTHNAADLMCHVWGIKNGAARPFGGEPAHFPSEREVMAWVKPRAILFHRAKDTSLIERLRELYENGHPNYQLPRRSAVLGAEPAVD